MDTKVVVDAMLIADNSPISSDDMTDNNDVAPPHKHGRKVDRVGDRAPMSDHGADYNDNHGYGPNEDVRETNVATDVAAAMTRRVVIPTQSVVPRTRTNDLLGQAVDWATLPDDELKRRATAAAHAHDRTVLWSLAEAYLTLQGRSGALLSTHTRRSYRVGVLALVDAWKEENLLHPRRNAGALWLRGLEADALSPSTLRVRLAAARSLYKALRWTGATESDPFTGARPPRDATAAWDKVAPYTPDEMEALLAHAPLELRVLLLLCAHAGLRRGEALALRWRDVHPVAYTLTVRRGKGNKVRQVALSSSLVEALTSWRSVEGGANGYVLSYRSETPAKTRLGELCRRLEIPYRGLHALRHTCGTRLVAETNGNLEEAARHLGHASLETTRVYAKWSDTTLRKTIGSW